MPANYVLLERIELNATTSSVTFSNIPQSGYTDLKIVGSIRNTLNPNDNIYISFNSDTTGSNYSSRQIYGTGSAAGSEVNTTTQRRAGITDGSGRTANTFSNTEIYIPNYSSTSAYKSYSSDSVEENNATAAVQTMVAGVWNSTAAINSITFTTENAGYSFVQYSTFSLYGLAATGTTPVIAPKASGGNITTDGTYWYHTFLSSGTFTPATGLTCDALVVAGGGGALGSESGSDQGTGGGGAGGYRAISSISFASGTGYTVTVGAGGSGSINRFNASTAGGNSSVNSYSSTGGGTSKWNATSGSGGSGAGSGPSQTAGSGNAGSYSPVEGYAGGVGATDGVTGNGAGGGGGAGAVGTASAAGTYQGGNGGVGLYNAISGGATTGAGQLSGGNYYFAGGGGGSAGRSNGTYMGVGGLGGGGTAPAGNATTNTGGGGGGAQGWASGSGFVGGNGGSGIVIVRYSVA